MANTMKAAVVREFKQPLAIEEVPVPKPGPGQVLVKIAASGVCHTDLHAAEGDWPVKPKPPFIPGHEGVGHVAAVGAGVRHVKEGDRVGVPWLYTACGHCRHCLGGWETLCESQQNTGYSVNGGFAEYVIADPDYVGHLPQKRLVCRYRADPVCRRHRLQGPQVDRNAAGRLGGRVRNRGAGPHGGSVCESNGTQRRRGGHQRVEARPRKEARRFARGECARDRPRRVREEGSRRGARRARDRSLPKAFEQALGMVGRGGRSRSSVCRPARSRSPSSTPC